ncbi:cysteine proteinase, partial [Tilletiopsis washingtonensis]
MPPRSTRRSAAAADAAAAPTAAEPEAAAASSSRPAKRARVSRSKAEAVEPATVAEEPVEAPAPPAGADAPPAGDWRGLSGEEAKEEPPAPASDVPPPPASPPPPPADELPPPPLDDVPPPPASPPPAPLDDIPPPPASPPPPAASAAPPPPPREAEVDEAAIEGAEYWQRLAQEEQAAKAAGKRSSSDVYLDTINRPLLDFDFEKLCSVSLANQNIYACLVCGRYFQGRGRSSHAYFHAVDVGHRVFLNLGSAKVYILPDSYEVHSAALSDILYLLHPTYTRASIARLDAPDARPSLALGATPYLPGFVGLNNIVGHSDYMNVVIQALAHVKPLRDYLLLGGFEDAAPLETTDTAGLRQLAHASELVKRLALLVRKLWNPRAFKAQVSPHEFAQEVTNVSGGRFRITQQADPVEFLGWLLNRLHMDLGGSRKKSREIQTSHSPFFLLALDLPAPPVFQSVIEKNIIPQVPIAHVLAKYDGVSFQEARGLIRRYKATRLPPYVVLHFRRFTKNAFVEERNPTIVNFPITGLNMRDYVDDESLAPLGAMYDLVANITHEATAGTVR